VRKIPASFILSDSNEQFINEWKSDHRLPTRTAAINQLLRLAQISIELVMKQRCMNSNNSGRSLIQGPMPASEMTEEQIEAYFTALLEPYSRKAPDRSQSSATELEDLFSGKV